MPESDMSTGTWIVLGIVVVIIAVVTLAFSLRLVFKLVRIKRELHNLGASGKWVFWGAMAYLVFPIDILPDPIYLDDVAVLGGALMFLTRLLKKQESLRGALPHAQKIAQRAAVRRKTPTAAPVSGKGGAPK
jgi:uncharacterized membrane protein YkvA (DUF1232 family)